MKIALISLYSTISSYGLRSISACLKQEGYEVNLIFLPQKWETRYDEEVLNNLVSLVREADLIGISLMTNHFDNAVQLTSRIKQSINTTVMWGGVHPTIRPEECLDYADIICVGEGEEAILELARKMREGENYLETKGLWFKKNDKIIRNEAAPLIKDLNSIPYQDYDYHSHHILTGNTIKIMNEDLIKSHLQNDYLAQPTRGCPFNCTYCCNTILNKMYLHQKPIRKRSASNLIGELMEVRNKLPFVQHITFDDDAFFCYSVDEITEFSTEYKRTIGLPLEIRGASPSTLTKPKLAPLVAAGLTSIRMGIQTGSERTKKMYGRPHSNQKVEDCVNIIHEFRDKIPLPQYDIIINNPWETHEDLVSTLMFFAKLPTPYRLSVFSLIFYPGTELYDKAVKDGIISDDLNDIYRKSYNVVADVTSGRLMNQSYINNLIYLLYVFSLNGLNLSTKTWMVMVNRKSNFLKSWFLYFIMKLRASFLLKKRLFKQTYSAVKGESIRDAYELD